MRTCGSCSLCCKVMGVPEVKERHKWCPHAKPGMKHEDGRERPVESGCTIYATRPHRCQEFNCLWLLNDRLGDHWFPAKSKIVVSLTLNPPILAFIVDEAYPQRWREEPYLSDIKKLAQAGLDGTPHYDAVVMIGDDTIPIIGQRGRKINSRVIG